MSATPLHSLPLTPSASTQQASAPRSGSRDQHGGTSFDTHLQSAQRQSSSSDAAQTNAKNRDAKQNGGTNNPDTTAQAAASSSNTAKPGDTGTDKAAQDNSANDNNTGTLASTVLSLIDHVTSDTHGNGASATPSKPPAQAGNKPAAIAQPIAPTAAMIPMLPPIVATATSTSNANAGTAQAATVTGTADGSTQKSLGFSVAGANAGIAFAADTSSTSNAANVGASTQSATDSSFQALTAGMAAASHASLPVIAAADSSSSQSTPDLAALGNLTAAASIVPSGTTATGTHNLAMNAPVGSSGFAKELGQQITWLSGQDVKQAQIRLNPQDLGPLDVKVSVEHGRVDVSFMTQHPAATAAVQQGLDQLNQMLSGQGLSLGHATVGQHAQQQFGAQQDPQAQASGNTSDEAIDTPLATAARVVVGLVDAFA